MSHNEINDMKYSLEVFFALKSRNQQHRLIYATFDRYIWTAPST